MEAIERLRGDAMIEIGNIRSPETSPGELPGCRIRLAGYEAAIDALIVQRSRLPDCPWGCGGKMERIPAAGVMSCDTCKSTALRGRF